MMWLVCVVLSVPSTAGLPAPHHLSPVCYLHVYETWGEQAPSEDYELKCNHISTKHRSARYSKTHNLQSVYSWVGPRNP